MSIRSAITFPIRAVLDLTFAVANRWLTTELDNPYLWPDAETAITPHHGLRLIGPTHPVHRSS